MHVPKNEYRVVLVDTALEERLNALASKGFEVHQMTDQRVLLVRTTSTTESERQQSEKSIKNTVG